MAWVIQVARNFTSDLEDAGRRFRFLIRDRDTKFTASFDEVYRPSGIEAIHTPVRSPQANAFAERWVRTVREECLDHLLIYSRVTSKRCSTPTCATTTKLARTGAVSSRPHCPAMTNHALVRSAAATCSAASSTSMTGLPEGQLPVPGERVQRVGRR